MHAIYSALIINFTDSLSQSKYLVLTLKCLSHFHSCSFLSLTVSLSVSWKCFSYFLSNCHLLSLLVFHIIILMSFFWIYLYITFLSVSLFLSCLIFHYLFLCCSLFLDGSALSSLFVCIFLYSSLVVCPPHPHPFFKFISTQMWLDFSRRRNLFWWPCLNGGDKQIVPAGFAKMLFWFNKCCRFAEFERWPVA